jgi:hypothetical protein
MPKIDKEMALEMMRNRQSDAEIASRFGTSRQAVNLLKKSFIAQGKIEFKLPTSRVESQPAPVPAEGQLLEGQPSATESGADPSYDQITEWVTYTINQASQVPHLREQLESAQKELTDLRSTNNLLRQQVEQASRDRASVMAKAAEYQQAIERLRASRQSAQP